MAEYDELYPRHVKALARAVKEAKAWRGALTDEAKIEEFDRFIATAQEALKRVRELARQHKMRRWVNSDRFPRA